MIQLALSPAGTFLPTRTTVRSALLAGAHQRPDHNHCTCPRPFAGRGGSGNMQDQRMGKESMQAEQRYLSKCASGIGPGMILLKAKVCTHHPAAMTCSRFLTSAGKSGFQGGRTPAGRGEKGDGTETGASSNQGLHPKRHWAPNLSSESKGKFGTSRARYFHTSMALGCTPYAFGQKIRQHKLKLMLGRTR